MKLRRVYLQRRRALLLVSQSAVQRSELALSTQDLQERLRPVDMGIAIVKVMREHPALMAASAALLLSPKRNKLAIWSSRLLTSWELFSLVYKQRRNTR